MPFPWATCRGTFIRRPQRGSTRLIPMALSRRRYLYFYYFADFQTYLYRNRKNGRFGCIAVGRKCFEESIPESPSISHQEFCVLREKLSGNTPSKQLRNLRILRSFFPGNFNFRLCRELPVEDFIYRNP